jgi:hypothetical protein
MNQYQKSIEQIRKVFDTQGSMPVQVLCDDFQDYICKYVEGIPAYKLFNEYVCACFAQLWELSVPDFAFVSISPHHVPIEILSNRTKKHFFEEICFGMRWEQDVQDLTNATRISEKEYQKVNKKDFLKIALFDIWLSNEDRNSNNYNLLYKIEANEIKWYVIDHSCCFNTGNLARGIEIITEEDSLISSVISSNLLKGDKKLSEIVQAIEREFYLCIEKCKQNLTTILNHLPAGWGIPQPYQKALNQLFKESWIKGVLQTFTHYIQLYLYK